METVIRLLLSNVPFVCLALGFTFAVVAIAVGSSPRTMRFVADRFLAWHVFFAIGVYYAYNFVVHVFFGEFTAKYIGWAQSPFQAEVGFASLGYAAVGFIAFRGEWTTRAAAIAASTCFLWGAAGGHIYQMAAEHNFAPGNAGGVFWSDVIIPVIGIALLGWARRSPALDASVGSGAVRPLAKGVSAV